MNMKTDGKKESKKQDSLPVIVSRAEWERERLEMLAMGISEYTKRKLTIPMAWVKEYNEITARMEQLNAPAH